VILKKVIPSTITLIFLIRVLLIAHSGRIDQYGGHHNKKTGGYHYHNAGRVHAADNLYQDHTKCGICNKFKNVDVSKYAKKNPKTLSFSRDEVIVPQAGLQCMGYKISNIDGFRGPETKKAIRKYIEDHKY